MTGIIGILEWRLPSEQPRFGSKIIAETLDGRYLTDIIDERWEAWSERIIRWAYIDYA